MAAGYGKHAHSPCLLSGYCIILSYIILGVAPSRSYNIGHANPTILYEGFYLLIQDWPWPPPPTCRDPNPASRELGLVGMSAHLLPLEGKEGKQFSFLDFTLNNLG